MFETKPSRFPEVNESNNPTEKKKGQAFNSNKYRGKNSRTKNQGPELETETEFKIRCSDLAVYILDIGPRASEKY